MNARFSKCLVSVVLIAAVAFALVPLAGAQETSLPPLTEPGPYGVRPMTTIRTTTCFCYGPRSTRTATACRTSAADRGVRDRPGSFAESGSCPCPKRYIRAIQSGSCVFNKGDTLEKNHDSGNCSMVGDGQYRLRSGKRTDTAV